jgi:ssDNA-binding Zn-finger/Zn-ribbon topoisomerase 1
MFFFKACPKCQGDLHMDRDTYGAFIKCLQCGLLRDVGNGSILSSIGNSRQASKLLVKQLEDLELTA